MIVSVHKSKAGVFASCLNNHPMVDIISADVKRIQLNMKLMHRISWNCLNGQ